MKVSCLYIKGTRKNGCNIVNKQNHTYTNKNSTDWNASKWLIKLKHDIIPLKFFILYVWFIKKKLKKHDFWFIANHNIVDHDQWYGSSFWKGNYWFFSLENIWSYMLLNASRYRTRMFYSGLIVMVYWLRYHGTQ